MGYMLVADFKARTIMPQDDVVRLEAAEPGFLQACLDDWSEEIDARLRKRYAVPFTTPPRTVLRWLVKLVTRDAFSKRGHNPTSSQDAEAIEAAAARAEAELKEAADSQQGLFDLPLLPATGSSAVSAGGPLAYSEQSPYRWTDLQLQNATPEDSNRGR